MRNDTAENNKNECKLLDVINMLMPSLLVVINILMPRLLHNLLNYLHMIMIFLTTLFWIIVCLR